MSDFEGTVGIEQFTNRIQPHSPGLAAASGAYRSSHPHPERARISPGLVVIPTDSATDDQIRRYREYAASRLERTKAPQGARHALLTRLRRQLR